MRVNTKNRILNNASLAVIEMRSALEMTQQEFAGEVMGCAISSLARYETTHPPTGNALLRFASKSAQYHLPESERAFRYLYAKEKLMEIPPDLYFDNLANRSDGVLITGIIGPEELAAARVFLDALRRLRATLARDVA